MLTDFRQWARRVDGPAAPKLPPIELLQIKSTSVEESRIIAKYYHELGLRDTERVVSHEGVVFFKLRYGSFRWRPYVDPRLETISFDEWERAINQ